MKAYKYRIYPSKPQTIFIDKNIENCRVLYNKLLAQKKEVYKKSGRDLSRKDLYKQVKGIKEMHSQVSQNVADRIDKAYRNLFARIKRREKKKGFPRFKKQGTYNSITMPQITNREKIGKKTYFPKIGWINTKYHRPITGIAKTLTLKKSKSGKYFITISCDRATNKQIKTADKEVGIDVGLNHFVTTSEGEFFEHPKPMKQFTKTRKKLEKRFNKTKKKSSNRNKARVKMARVDEKITNIRNEFGWKLCHILIKKYRTIYVEDLNIKRMQKNHYLAKAITDVAWMDFLQKLSYKAESAGGQVVKVNPKNTSQKCSGCDKIVRKGLNKRMHKCPACGLEIDRDINAARNILTIGKIGQELSELKPERDKASIVSVSKRQALSMKQEAATSVKSLR